jgi:hypothetical protein
MTALELLLQPDTDGAQSQLQIDAAAELAALTAEVERLRLVESAARKLLAVNAELAALKAEVERLRLVESAAKKLLAAKPTKRWTVDEMNALDDALKESK